MLARNLLTRIWLTFKQQRFETIALTVVCLGLAAAALIEAYRLNSMNVSMACFQTYQGPIWQMQGVHLTAEQLRCAPLVESFVSLQNSTDMSVVGLMLVLAPILVGIIYGAPMVARELEQGTAPLSWALSGSRRRWLLGKVLAGVALIVPLTLTIGLAANVLQSALSPGIDVYAAFENFMGRGVIVVFWALAAYAGTLALGSLIGRTLPAVVLALVICFFARTLWEPALTHSLLRPIAVEQNTSENSAQQVYSRFLTGGVDMPVYARDYMDGKPFEGDSYQWWMEHQPVYATPAPLATVDPSSGATASGPISVAPAPPPLDGPYPVYFVIPGSQYWPITALESGMLLLGALFCAAVAMFRVERRRPY